MDQNRFTEKSLEALSAAQRLAAKLNHQQMDVEHLLLSLLDQERGLAGSILTKAEVPLDGLKIKVQRELEKLPRVTGASGSIHGIPSVAERRSSTRTVRRTCVLSKAPSGIALWLE